MPFHTSRARGSMCLPSNSKAEYSMSDMLSKARADEQGRAFAGSQLQIQIYVNRYPHELTQAVIVVINSTSVAAPIRWVSPIEQERFREYKDAAFLQALNLSRLRSLLAQFWPPSGPRW